MAYEIPPHKRPRLEPQGGSPIAISPYAATPSPTTPGIHLHGPTNPFSFNSPQPLHTPGGIAYEIPNIAPAMGTPGGLMGPPSTIPNRQQGQQMGQQAQHQGRPEERQQEEKGADVNSLMDVMSGTGVDLKAEEAAMMASYRESQPSFGSSHTMSTGTSFDARNFSFPSGGSLSQTLSQEQIEAEVAAQQRRQARLYNERSSQPLYNPFLMMDVLRKKIQDSAYKNGARVQIEGLYVKTRPEPRTNPALTVMHGNDLNGSGANGIVKAEAGAWIAHDAALVDILSLLSLAANERLRTLCDDAYGLARGRQSSADGVVDPQWVDLAVSDSKASDAAAAPLSISHTAWDKAPDSAISPTARAPLKRPLEATNGNHGNRLPTPPSEPSPAPQPTKSFANATALHLRDLAKADLEHEKARILARQRRQRQASGAANGSAGPGDGSASGTATPEGGLAPGVEGALSQGLSKKALEKQRKAKAEDPNQMHSNATTVLNKALGGGRKYSWMTGGKAKEAAPAPPSRLNTSVGASTPTAAGGSVSGSRPSTAQGKQGEPGLQARDRRLGEWREDGRGGAGVQMRDLLSVLDHDGKCRRTYVKALTWLKSADVPEASEVVGDAR